ncbi:NAD-dependent epimerase/dehydratase family protein [Mucilaginibacter jinjuensis]|uniref:NAD(P)-dependent oxidoreductase n=1 Tax=Mucilaginibacter jinjuensis TaxID=1176721 RepID=A0ABY7T940_9SPHI|nr:NAD(P)-dependent oxidoreductase [Mucilaginibacter jinjuensis]WCT12748.1 NAD(P)-dependent oxidoreductase [Mucilaginibacter jinjuensis]
MKILVTGSAGKLGSVTVEHLRKHNYEVTGADIITSTTTNLILDIKDKQAVLEATQGYDAIIHTAAIHGKHYELGYPRELFIDTNIYGTLNLLNACVTNGIRQFLYISTTSIYGKAMVDENQAVWVTEELQEQPRDIYDITKQTAEQLCKDFFYKEGLQTSVYRVGRFLPEDDNLQANHRLYRGLDERDAAEALRLALSHIFIDFEVFNITSGSPFNEADVTRLKHFPVEVIKQYYPDIEAIYKAKGWILPTSIDRIYRCDKAQQYLGYKPKFTFDYLLGE